MYTKNCPSNTNGRPIKDDFFDVLRFDELDSTNTYLKTLAKNGAKEGVVVVADAQSAGKGSKGRDFFSPKGSGIYMSVLLRPPFESQKCLYITPMAAVAVCESIEETCGVYPSVKWVNDLYLNDKKICGILTESKFSDDDAARIEYCVLGIGINLFFPECGFGDLSDAAGCVSTKRDDDLKDLLIKKILQKIKFYYDDLDKKPFLQKYRQKCFLRGKLVTVLPQNRQATVEGVTDEFDLAVTFLDGTTQILNSGEVSLKL